MKITGIEIGEYRQFKNIKFDFTYPADYHDKDKVGKPLEKVCFIGQSGTGKTTLLNVVQSFIKGLAGVFSHKEEYSSALTDVAGITLKIKIANKLYNLQGTGNYQKDINNFYESISNQGSIDSLLNTHKLGISIKDNVAQESHHFLYQSGHTKALIATEHQINAEKIKHQKEVSDDGASRVIDLGNDWHPYIWEFLLNDIHEYDEKGRNLALALINEKGSFSADRIINELKKWKENTNNPRTTLAEVCLNPILKKFFLEMDTDSTEVLISLRTKKGVNIDNSYLSAGTRQILATAIPIYKFNTKDTVILFDEPERSLFPDIQRELISYYTSLAPEAQFFFATHSPIIASAFEPCERFILFFNENGEVDYHTGIAPEGDDPNDILRQDFAMAELMLQKGLDEYERYRQLAMQIRAETDEEKKNQLIIERLELGNRYNFAGQYAQSK